MHATVDLESDDFEMLNAAGYDSLAAGATLLAVAFGDAASPFHLEARGGRRFGPPAGQQPPSGPGRLYVATDIVPLVGEVVLNRRQEVGSGSVRQADVAAARVVQLKLTRSVEFRHIPAELRPNDLLKLVDLDGPQFGYSQMFADQVIASSQLNRSRGFVGFSWRSERTANELCYLFVEQWCPADLFAPNPAVDRLLGADWLSATRTAFRRHGFKLKLNRPR